MQRTLLILALALGWLACSGLKDLQGKTVATVKGYSITDTLVRDYPDLRLRLTENTLEALQSVAVGQADAVIDTLAVGIYYIRKQNLANLKVAAPARVPPLCVGIVAHPRDESRGTPRPGEACEARDRSGHQCSDRT